MHRFPSGAMAVNQMMGERFHIDDVTFYVIKAVFAPIGLQVDVAAVEKFSFLGG